MTQVNDNDLCFVCGQDNPDGLRLVFGHGKSGEGVETTVVFEPKYQGWKGIIHGGLLSTLLDEVMVKAAAHAGHLCVTAELTVKFKKPAEVGVSYRVWGRVTSIRQKLVFTEGRVEDGDGGILATATAKFFSLERRPPAGR
jgi:uncharacterized protein (TIGR00369 family)